MRPSYSRRFSILALVVTAAAATVPQAASAATAPAKPRIASSYPILGEKREADRTLLKTQKGATDFVLYHPDGRSVAATGRDRTVRVWDARPGEEGTGRQLHNLTGPLTALVGLAYSADGRHLTALGDDGQVQTWDTTTARSVFDRKTKALVKNSVLYPGNEPWLAETHAEGVRLWNVRTGETVRNFTMQNAAFRYAAFSRDGALLVAITRHGGIRVWDVATGTYLRGHDTRSPIAGVVVGPTHIAVGGSHGGIQLWPLAGGDLVSFAGNFPVAFSPDGDQLAGASEKSVLVWDVASGQLLCAQEGHGAEVTSIAFNSNGQKMASADLDGMVKYWTVPLPPLPPDSLAKIAAAAPSRAAVAPKKSRRLLVFWRSDTVLHPAGVPAVNHALELMEEKTGAFSVDFTRDYAALEPKTLANYDALVLNSTAHLVIPEAAKKALLDFVRRGGGIVGVHAAIDTFKAWPEGAAIIGATFGGQPWAPSGTWAVKLDEPAHPLVRAWSGQNFKLRDEFYAMAEPYSRANRRVLLSMDLSDATTANPGTEPLRRTDGDFAVSWIKRFGEGRVFYSGIGHHAEPFHQTAVQQFYLDGIQYVLGDLDLAPAEQPPVSR